MSIQECKADGILKKGQVTITNGPLAGLLEEVLAKHKVRKQAYHSQSFVGNHVKIMLKVGVINTFPHLSGISGVHILILINKLFTVLFFILHSRRRR